MGILDDLIGGGQRQKEYRDFVDRYEQGDPSEGYSDQEVLKRYGDVSHAVPPDQYAQAAIEALGKLSPEERAAFVKMLQQRAAARGVALPGQVAPEPKELGEVLTDLHGSPVSSGISSSVATPSLRSKRNRRTRSSTYLRPRRQRPCSRASRPWWSSVSCRVHPEPRSACVRPAKARGKKPSLNGGSDGYPQHRSRRGQAAKGRTCWRF